MRLRSKKILSLLLAASLVLSFNSAVLAEEIKDSEAEALSVEDETGEAGLMSSVSDGWLFTEKWEASTNDPSANRIMSGSITLTPGTAETRVSENGTTAVKEINRAIIENMEFSVSGDTYYAKDSRLYKKSDDSVVSKKFTYNSVNISLNGIRMAGADLKDAKAVEYTDDRKNVVKDTKGNQLINYSVTINDKDLLLYLKECNTVTGDIFLKTYYSGSVSEERVTFGDGDLAVLIRYDAAVEYRGKNVTPTSHFIASDNDSVSGDVDGAVGVSARLEKKVSGNWVPMDGKRSDSYYWKDTTGITIKKPKIYNGKKVGAYYESGGPYFTIKVSYKKNQMPNDLLTQEQKAALKSAMSSARFTFTIEPRKLSTDMVTYNKYETGKYYVKKFTYNSAKNILKGNLQFRKLKGKKSTLNVRKAQKVGKKLLIVSKSAYDSRHNKKTDAYFEYDSNTKEVTLTGINGYYGTAVIDGDHVSVK
ncbi:MAG: hypothetical protein IJU87_03625 [Lachnospiraceae bacterium]|nr:hypothetical protein [Lachnospiraceae bacterium]